MSSDCNLSRPIHLSLKKEYLEFKQKSSQYDLMISLAKAIVYGYVSVISPTNLYLKPQCGLCRRPLNHYVVRSLVHSVL